MRHESKECDSSRHISSSQGLRQNGRRGPEVRHQRVSSSLHQASLLNVPTKQVSQTTYVHTYLLTSLHLYIRTYIHTYLHTYTLTHLHTSFWRVCSPRKRDTMEFKMPSVLLANCHDTPHRVTDRQFQSAMSENEIAGDTIDPNTFLTPSCREVRSSSKSL